MNSNDENMPRNRLYVNEEGSFTAKGIAEIKGSGKLLRTPRDRTLEKQHARDKVKVPLVLATVQHTASRFFVSLLQEHYGPPWPLHERGAPFYFDHCSDRNIDSIIARVSEGALLVTTTRDWGECIESWKRRGVNTEEEFIEQQNNWYDYIRPSALVVSAFTPDRDMLLLDLSRAIGIELETNWKPVG